MELSQPIIRGIQAVGSVSIRYTYNSSSNVLKIPTSLIKIGDVADGDQEIDTAGGVAVAGFRLDGEFLRAIQQIASSIVIPILGGGGVALTNNNRTGTLNINCTKVSTPSPSQATGGAVGAMYKGPGIGPDQDNVYDLVFLAQVQQAQPGGDSVGATLDVGFSFCGLNTVVQFQGCTIASVDPLGLAGNDAPNYGVSINYLNWTVHVSQNGTANPLGYTPSSGESGNGNG